MDLSGADYGLLWPRDVFSHEASAILAGRNDDQMILLLVDAFAGQQPVNDFEALSPTPSFPSGRPSGSTRRDLAVQLIAAADSGELREVIERTPYWRQRVANVEPSAVSLRSLVDQFVRLVQSLDARGYFEEKFGKDCVDNHVDVSPSGVIADHLGIDHLWPLNTRELAREPDVFFSVIEVLHDLISRPRNRWHHRYSDCGWHYTDFTLDAGRRLYRAQVNQLLDQSSQNLQLGSIGEEAGRLIATTDTGRSELMSAMIARQDDATGDEVRHAIALFRGRAATSLDKTSAIVTLARILEERRKHLKAGLSKRDEGALFQIANEFNLRHKNSRQQGDYDTMFLDWIFWWYLATIELSDRLITRSEGDPHRSG